MATATVNSPLVAVVGETASGKSSLALAIAERYNGELVCADSRTIFTGMDVGTAKPSAADQARVPHHLLDVAAPNEHFTAAQFQQLATQAIADINTRGHLPVIVGGTGLYVDSILFDYQFGGQSAADAALRARLQVLSVDELRAYAASQGVEIPADMTNARHIMRTIERGGDTSSDRHEMRPNTLVVGLQISRNKLRTHIEQRVEDMFRKGLRREVDELIATYGWDSEALTGIGYREFRPFYEGQASMSAVKRQIVQNTLQLAKRQRTWFKRNPHIVWCETPEQALKIVDDFITSKQS